MQAYDAFFQAIQKQPLSAALILGKLVASKQSRQLNKIKADINDHQLESLVHAMMDLSPKQKASLDGDTIMLLTRLNMRLLKDDGFACKLSQDSIILLSQDETLLRWGLKRLIELDHHQIIPIPSDYLDKFGPEHTDEVAKYYQDVAKLPLHAIIQLANTSQTANIMLLDLKNHPGRFELAQCLIDKHPSLADGIAKQWIQESKAQPKTRKEKKSQRKVSRQLETKHPAFKKIPKVKRRKQIAIQPGPTSSRLLTPGNIAFGSWMTFNLMTPNPVGIAQALTFSARLAGPYLAYQAGRCVRGYMLGNQSSSQPKPPKP